MTRLLALFSIRLLVAACDSPSAVSPDSVEPAPSDAVTSAISGPGNDDRTLCTDQSYTFTENSTCSGTLFWAYRPAGSNDPWTRPFPTDTGNPIDITFYNAGSYERATCCEKGNPFGFASTGCDWNNTHPNIESTEDVYVIDC